MQNSSYLRQYSINTQTDVYNIDNLRCPDYALHWNHEHNQYHWNRGHDYFLGNGENLMDNQELRHILSEKLNRGTLPNKIIFCDLDGVLADFDQGVYALTHKYPSQLKSSIMWSMINRSTDFFETLPWIEEGRQLWEQIKQYDPIILTGIPNTPGAEEQKRAWCARELGPDIHVITCASRDKPKYCVGQSVLIDDRMENIQAWKAKGGNSIFYYKRDVKEVIQKVHGYMNSEDEYRYSF